METVRTLVLSFCSLSLLYAMLHDVTAKSSCFSVIKLACTLYILITLFTVLDSDKISAIDIPRESMGNYQQTENTDFYQKAVLAVAEENAENQIQEQLAMQGYTISDVAVTLQVDENKVSLQQLTVTVPFEQEGMKQQLHDSLFCEAQIIVKEEGYE